MYDVTKGVREKLANAQSNMTALFYALCCNLIANSQLFLWRMCRCAWATSGGEGTQLILASLMGVYIFDKR